MVLLARKLVILLLFLAWVPLTQAQTPVAPAPLTIICNSNTGEVNGVCVLDPAFKPGSYSTRLEVTGGVPPYTWSATGLPPGLSIDSRTGVISGTPTLLGIFTPNVIVKDSTGSSAMRRFSLTVNGVATLTVSPITLTFTARAGQNPLAQPVNIQVDSNTATVKADISYANTRDWLNAVPSATSLDFRVAPDVSALSTGTYKATLTVSCTGQVCNPSAVPVGITLNVSPFTIGVTPSPAATANLAPGTTQALPFDVSTSDGLLQDVLIAVKTSSGGNWLRSALQGIQAPGKASSISIDTTGMSTGTYMGTVTFSCPANSCTAVQIPITLNVSSGPNAPTIRSVISASAFGGFSTISPGSYVEIYGSNLSTTDPGRTWSGADFTNDGQTAPTSLDRTTGLVGGQAAFVYFVSPGQINVLVPSNVGTGPSTLTVTSPTGTSAPYAITIDPVEPGFLAPLRFQNASKQYVAALLDAQTFAVPTGAIPGVASRPARPGETILIYGLGFGAVNPQTNAGTVVSQANSLSMPLQLLFGNTPSQLTYSGLAPGFTGLYQFNVVVPAVPDNDAVPLTLNLGGVNGKQTLYIAVRR